MRTCPSCGLTKAFDQFPRNRRTKSGYATYCKPCHNAKGQASRERAGGARKYHLWLRYGLTLGDLEAMRTAQDNKCAICGALDPEHVDHCHTTNRVRGLLCFGCNGGLGQFRDDVDRLKRAIDYLEEAERRTDLPLARPSRRPGSSTQPRLPLEAEA